MGEQPATMSLEELRTKLEDIDIPDSELRQYLRINEDLSQAFDPVVDINWDRVTSDEPIEESFAVDFLNRLSRLRRRLRYERKISSGFDGVKIVSEGDSWFQYPFFLEDIIDHIGKRDDFAVRSLGAAGDLLENMARDAEFEEVVEEEKPTYFLLSGGGNDMLGDGRLETLLHPFDADLAPDQYPNEAFAEFETELVSRYRALLQRLEERFPALNVLYHGYDYVIPAGGRWLGAPMRRIGIDDMALQQAIMRALIDRFNVTLARIGDGSSRATYVDCRGAVTSWHDELHPTSVDYGKAAKRFVRCLRTMI